MGVDFKHEQWGKIKETSCNWWAGKLDRPLIQVRVHGRNPGRQKPKLPSHGFASFYSLDTPADAIADRWDYDLLCTEYLGDAFPYIFPNFGAGVIATLMGAELRNSEDSTWFFPHKQQKIADIHFEYDPDNVWLNRIRDIYKAAKERWQDKVLLAMTDLGGNLDILSSFRPSEKLLMDLYDFPDHVKRLTWEAHEMWFKYFSEYHKIIQSAKTGYTAWTPIFSKDPYYMLQCDFCYMISPDMFNEFVKPELIATCKRLTNPFYHLDGPGQLPHLDSLLEIKELKGVQWVPGAGQPDITEWSEVYRKIRKAGKLIQVFASQSDKGLKALDILSDQLGDAKGIIIIADIGIDKKDEAIAFLKKYGI